MSAQEMAAVVARIEPVSDRVGPDALRGTVLIADDDPVNREVLRRLLSQQGHRVAEAADGNEALRLLGERGFDVLLDVLMPGCLERERRMPVRAAGS
jgi:CheY-like chemotaxis protein